MQPANDSAQWQPGSEPRGRRPESIGPTLVTGLRIPNARDNGWLREVLAAAKCGELLRGQLGPGVSDLTCAARRHSRPERTGLRPNEEHDRELHYGPAAPRRKLGAAAAGCLEEVAELANQGRAAHETGGARQTPRRPGAQGGGLQVRAGGPHPQEEVPATDKCGSEDPSAVGRLEEDIYRGPARLLPRPLAALASAAAA
mmetsp:Transcript_38788/g.86832  ORF Transcript_38788/g.86832 Transcript_38788/m.86832 type:complete len:200 (+) Transcript_38788:294-893(+)